MSEEKSSSNSTSGGSSTPSGTTSSKEVSLGHHPIIPPRSGESPSRLQPELLESYRRSMVPDVSDAVGRLYTMSSRIRPLYEPMRRIVGTALTVKVPPGDNWAIHGALNMAQQNDVLVVDWQGYSDGCGAGVNTLVSARDRGLVGVVVDGCWRDIDELQALDFPVCGRGISAFSPAKRELGEINVPVCCGGVIVEPGDVVVADREGSVIVPRRHAEEVAQSLPDYELKHSIDDYPRDALENTVGKIAEAYQKAFEAYGGRSR